jgi:hypothetical protein
MALIKSIELESGINVNYHRITTLTIVTNIQNIIEISSYTSKEKRQEQIESLEKGEFSKVYVHTKLMGIPYDQNATIESTYEYLKTLPIFEGSEDD